MEDDIKYPLQKIQETLEGIKRDDLNKIKEKLRDLNVEELKYALKEIKGKLEEIEIKLQK